MPIIIEKLNHELDTTKQLFEAGKINTPIDYYFPPCAGTLFWLYKLKERIREPMENFKQVENDLINSEDALHVFDKYDEMMALIQDAAIKTFNTWAAPIDEKVASLMEKTLITRDPDTTLLSLNLDPALEETLREVK